VKVGLAPNGLLTGSAADSAEELTETVEADKLTKARVRQAWQITTKPVQQILMQGFMMYMSGSTINIFSIMITSMAFINPLTAIANVNSTFARLDDGKIDLTMQKLAFVAVQILGLLLAMWKCGTMGLLPLTSADWSGYIVIRKALEAAGVGTPVDIF